MPQTAAVAHELKTPLSNIRYISEALLDDTIGGAEPAQLARQLRLIKDIAQQGLATVDGLTLAYGASQLSLELEALNANLICQEIMHQVAPLTDNLGVTARLSLPVSPLKVVANRRALYSVLGNLCDNALRHASGKNGFDLSLGRSHKLVVFSVNDYGPKLELTQFRRLKGSLGRQVQPISGRSGSGLGLVIAAELTEAMNGNLRLVRHRAGGMTFKIGLPASGQLSWI